jgi:integrase/recombinase XerD
LTWEAPIYKAVHKIPFIPTEKEIDTLIAACGPKLSTFLQLAKETAARSGELQNLKWIDLDVERRTVRITAEKNSNPRILKISSKCVGMLQTLSRKDEKIFGNIGYNSLRTGFGHQRKKIARKLNNPRLKEIHFHTLRHWKATILYHQTKDILYVMQYLGHKKVESTLLYIQLENALFKDTSDEFTVRIATKPDIIKELLEAGFEFVCQKDELMYFRKRK